MSRVKKAAAMTGVTLALMVFLVGAAFYAAITMVSDAVDRVVKR